MEFNCQLLQAIDNENFFVTQPNGVIYAITNLINGKQYVGLTTTSLEERWERHIEQALSKKASLLHKAIAEDSQKNFTVEIIDRAFSIKDLTAKERYWIKKLNTLNPNGYNVTLGGRLAALQAKQLGYPETLHFTPLLKPPPPL